MYQRETCTGRMQIDKQAASRFITHAINSQKSRIDPDYQAEGEEGAEEFEVEGGKHTRFDAAQEREGENEEVERLLDDELEESDEEEQKEVVKKGEGKEKELKKGGRKVLDPFAGEHYSLLTIPFSDRMSNEAEWRYRLRSTETITFNSSIEISSLISREKETIRY